MSQPLPAAQSRTYCLSKLGWPPPGLVAVGGPVARGVGCQHLVAEHHERAVLVEAQLELRVRQDHPALARVRGRERVQLDRHLAHPLHQRTVADQLGGALEVDRLVVADLGLRARREDRLGQLLGLAQPRGNSIPETAPVAW